MKTLQQHVYRSEILHRVASVSLTDQRRWGRMSAHGMLTHLADAYRLPLGERAASDATGLLQRTLVKYLALYSPMPWPKGIQTRPEIDQEISGSAPTEFATDRQTALHLIDRFCSLLDGQHPPHPIFGRLTQNEWMRWGYLHTDHHLRQFGR